MKMDGDKVKKESKQIDDKIKSSEYKKRTKNRSKSIELNETNELNRQIDFLSEEFSPEIVLNLPDDKINLPVPDAKLFNNLDEYALKSFPAKRPSSNPNEQTDLDILRKQNEIRDRMKEKIILLDSKRKKQSNYVPHTVLNLMNKSENGLGRFLDKRIRIFIRRRRKSKHPCEQYACLFGQLMFFDRHWNLILADVIETMQYVNDRSNFNNLEQKFNESSNMNKEMINKEIMKNEPNSVDENRSNYLNDERSGLSTSLISSIDNRRLLIEKNSNSECSVRISIRERHFTRLFIRGDNIIYISKI